MVTESDESRDRYRSNYDRISWTNSRRPEYQGGVRPVYGTPRNAIDVTPPGTAIVKEQK